MGHAAEGACMPAAALRWLELEPYARMLVDRRLRVFWASGAALRLLKSDSGVALSAGALQCVDPAAQRRLAAFVLDLDSEWGTLTLLSSASLLLVCARRLSAPDEEALFGLEFTDANATAARFHDIRAAFSITDAEQRVAIAMLEGANVGDIASATGQTEATVRTHVRKLYQKLDVTSRESLMNRLHPFRIQCAIP